MVRLLLVAGLLVTAQSQALAQTGSKVRLEISSTAPAKIRVEVQNSSLHRDWSFRNTIGPVLGLGTRIEQFAAIPTGEDDTTVTVVAPGEFTLSRERSRVSYVVNLSEETPLTERAHVSWLGRTEGLLMLGDLLPISVQREVLTLNLVLPSGWSTSSFAVSEGGSFYVAKPADTVIAVGTQIKEKAKQVDTLKLTTSLVGDWPIKADAIAKVSQKIIREYSELTGFRLSENAHVIVVADSNSRPERWTAEARGPTVTLVMGTRAQPQALLGRASVVLAHELFHLWVPNSLHLQGNYAWFFEGFTLYQALLTTLKLGWINFQEFLRTLGAVHDAYFRAPDKDRWALVQLSDRRWTVGSPLVYEKGMLVGFLYDLERRLTTGGREGLFEIYRELFNLRAASVLDANEVIIALLNQAQGMNDFAANFVTNPGPLKLADLLPRYGIKLERDNFRTSLTVASDLSETQRRILRGLGYKK